MDEAVLRDSLGDELIREWDVVETGGGFMVISDWKWPNSERIEVYVRTVGEREDLFLVSDGGDLFNFLFSQGIDLTSDAHAMKVFRSVARNYGADFVDYQIVKGANEGDLPRAVRMVVEAVKDASLILWYKFKDEEGGQPS